MAREMDIIAELNSHRMDIDVTPSGKHEYIKYFNETLTDEIADIVRNPSKIDLRFLVGRTQKSLLKLKHYYILPMLLVDFHIISTEFLHKDKRLERYLEYFWEALREEGIARAFKVFITDKSKTLYEKKEGFQSDVLSRIIGSTQQLDSTVDSVQIAYFSMITEKLIRIHTLEYFNKLDKEGFISNYDFEDINSRPLNRLIDSHCLLTDLGREKIYNCLKKDHEKVFAFNLEFRKITKAILVDRSKWSIRNKYVHSHFEIDDGSTSNELNIIQLYMFYFINKVNTKLYKANWEYIEDNWSKLKPKER